MDSDRVKNEPVDAVDDDGTDSPDRRRSEVQDRRSFLLTVCVSVAAFGRFPTPLSTFLHCLVSPDDG